MSSMKTVRARALLEDLEWKQAYGLGDLLGSRVDGPTTIAEHLLVVPNRTLTVEHGEPLRQAMDASEVAWGLDQKYDRAGSRAARERCRILVRGELRGAGASRTLMVHFPNSIEPKSLKQSFFDVNVGDVGVPEGPIWGLLDLGGWATRKAMASLTGEPQLQDLTLVVPDLGPLPIPVGEQGELGYWFRVLRINIPLILRLDLADLGVDYLHQQRCVVTALAGLALADPAVAPVRVGDTPLIDWVRDLLLLSQKRKKWRKKLEKHSATRAQHARDIRNRELARELPAPRLLKSARAAEEYAAEVMRSLGYSDALATGLGSDGGIDVASSGALAQVKMEAVATGRPVLQAIFGVANLDGKAAVVFSLAGFTAQALEWAERARVACFEFAFDGSIIARSAAAQDALLHRESGLIQVHQADQATMPEPQAPSVAQFPVFGQVSEEVQTLLDMRFSTST